MMIQAKQLSAFGKCTGEQTESSIFGPVLAYIRTHATSAAITHCRVTDGTFPAFLSGAHDVLSACFRQRRTVPIEAWARYFLYSNS
jgi:hypothetical protein